jgi:hypothetical protein
VKRATATQKHFRTSTTRRRMGREKRATAAQA